MNDLATHIGYWVYALIGIILLATGTFPAWASITVLVLVFANLAFQLVVMARLLKGAKVR